MTTQNKQVKRIEGTLEAPVFINPKQVVFNVGGSGGRDRTEMIYKDGNTFEHKFITMEHVEDLISQNLTIPSGAFVVVTTADELKSALENTLELSILASGVDIPDSSFSCSVISSKTVLLDGRNGIKFSGSATTLANFISFPTISAVRDISIEFLGTWDSDYCTNFGVTGGYSGNTFDYSVFFEWCNSSVTVSNFVDLKYIKTDLLNIGGALTGTVGSTKSINSVGDFSVNTNKFTVAASTGTTYVGGVLSVGNSTPRSDWASNYKSIQIGAGGALMAAVVGTNIYVNANVYFDGTSWRYLTASGFGSVYVQGEGDHSWRTTPTVSTGIGGEIAPVDRMRLTQAGDLLLNTNKFTVTGATGNTTIAGTLGVAGAITGASYSGGAISGTTGSFSSTLGCTGNFAVNTNKFTVNATTGDIAITGALNLFSTLNVSSSTLVVNKGIQSNGSVVADTFRNLSLLHCRFGSEALSINIGNDNTAFGNGALRKNTTGYESTAVGDSALENNETGYKNTAIGHRALLDNTTGYESTAVGESSLAWNVSGYQNSAFGVGSMYLNEEGYRNSAFGYGALRYQQYNVENSAFGHEAMSTTGLADYSCAFGSGAGKSMRGFFNVAIGKSSLSGATGIDCNFNTGLGGLALNGLIEYFNCSGVGYNAQVDGSNQVQLGDSATNTYVYGTVQDRSDERDKADIIDCRLGLDFIEKVRPINFKWDYREDYWERIETTEIIVDENDEEKEVPKIEIIKHERDGSKKRNRYHSGVSAQQVKEVLDELGEDWAGYQDHAVNGGGDRLTIGYNQFIAPLIKSVQELSAKNKALEEQNISILSRLEALENA